MLLAGNLYWILENFAHDSLTRKQANCHGTYIGTLYGTVLNTQGSLYVRYNTVRYRTVRYQTVTLLYGTVRYGTVLVLNTVIRSTFYRTVPYGECDRITTLRKAILERHPRVEL